MGCSFTKTNPDSLESEPQTSAIPLLARSEWENILLTNDLSMDQDNFDLAKERFEERERLHNHNQNSFEKLRTNAEQQMSVRKENIEVFLRHECGRVKLREKNLKDKEENFEEMRTKEEKENLEKRKKMKCEQVFLRDEYCRVQVRENDLKDKETNFEVKKAHGEEVMLLHLTKYRLAQLSQLEEAAVIQFTNYSLKKEEDGFEDKRSKGQGDMLAVEDSLILGQEKHRHQYKGIALALFVERE